MHRFKTLQTYFNEALEKEQFGGTPAALYNPIAYTMQLGGKRLRPVLCLASCELFGGTLSDALNAAIGLELFHNFTLLHDDIMDEAPIRRGEASVYKKWNSNVAILSGDTMFAKAYEYIGKTSPQKLPDIHRVFTQTAIEVCEGQQYDMDFENRIQVSKDEYINMIRLKTAALLGGSLQIGGIIGDASDEDLEHIYKFGEYLGIAFQLKDDLLDAYADQAKFGKQTGNDIVTNKKTFLLISALKIADETAKSRLLELYSSSAKTDNGSKVKEVLAIFEKWNIKTMTEKAIMDYQQKAITELEAIKMSESRKGTLLAITDYLNKREM
jgi:geranylgeranyl diphosphate synthase type II